MMRIKSYMYVFMYLLYLQDMNLYADISGRTLPVTKTDKPDLYQVRHKNISKYMLFSESEVPVLGTKLHLLNIY